MFKLQREQMIPQLEGMEIAKWVDCLCSRLAEILSLDKNFIVTHKSCICLGQVVRTVILSYNIVDEVI